MFAVAEELLSQAMVLALQNRFPEDSKVGITNGKNENAEKTFMLTEVL